jgi:flagellar FliL protein
MAEENKPAEAKEGEAAEPQKGKKSKKLLWIVLAAIVLGGGGGGAAIVLMGGEEAAETTSSAPAEQPPGLVAMDTFLVNLSDPGGDRYMKLTLRLAISPVAEANKIDENELLLARMRDRILTVLAAKTFQELVSPLGKESLRHEIQAQLEPLLDKAQLQDVLFSEFVVQ